MLSLEPCIPSGGSGGGSGGAGCRHPLLLSGCDHHLTDVKHGLPGRAAAPTDAVLAHWRVVELKVALCMAGWALNLQTVGSNGNNEPNYTMQAGFRVPAGGSESSVRAGELGVSLCTF